MIELRISYYLVRLSGNPPTQTEDGKWAWVDKVMDTGVHHWVDAQVVTDIKKYPPAEAFIAAYEQRMTEFRAELGE